MRHTTSARRTQTWLALRASVASAAFALALGTGGHAWAQPDADAAPDGGATAPVGIASIGEWESEWKELGALGAAAEALSAWLDEEDSGSLGAWFGDFAGALHAGEKGVWSMELGAQAFPEFEARSVEAPRAPVNIALDVNAYRDASPQPFSRSVRGRVLDALGIDNARGARLLVMPTPEGADAPEAPFTLFMLTESRGDPPGRTGGAAFATLGFADRSPEANRPVAPLELKWAPNAFAPLVYSMADVSIASDPLCDLLSPRERGNAWGQTRLVALQRLTRVFDGRVWIWDGHGLAIALPLRPSATDRDVADALRTVLGVRLVWSRDAENRAIGTWAIKRDASAPRDGDTTLSLRFIRVQQRGALVIVTDPEDLAEAGEVLAEVLP